MIRQRIEYDERGRPVTMVCSGGWTRQMTSTYTEDLSAPIREIVDRNLFEAIPLPYTEVHISDLDGRLLATCHRLPGDPRNGERRESCWLAESDDVWHSVTPKAPEPWPRKMVARYFNAEENLLDIREVDPDEIQVEECWQTPGGPK